METSQATSVRYVIDGKVSRFTVRAFAGGLLSSFGHNPTIAIRDLKGEAQFHPDAMQEASLKISIAAGSLAVQGDVNEKDRSEMETKMRDEVLETSRFPEIAFESTQVSANKVNDGRYAVNVTGNLSLHGVTRGLTFPADVSLLGDMLRASGKFSLLQTDYNIPLVSVAGGAMKLKDELNFSLDIVARKQA